MKKIFILSVSIFALLSFASCEDDSKDPLPQQVKGQFIRLDIDRYHRQMNFNEIETTYFGGLLTNPDGNVVKYDIHVRRSDPSNNVTSDYVPMMTITSFPYDLKITPAMVAQALGLQISDLKDGDFYRFYGYSYDASGRVATYRNLSSLNQFTPEMEQGYRVNTNLTINPQPTGDDDEPYDNRNPN